MKDLVTQILVKNHEKTIEVTLQSILPLNGKIVIGDLGSQDKTIDICKKYTDDIVKVDLKIGYDRIRNSIFASHPARWRFYIDPWESLEYGAREIAESIESKEEKSYYFSVFRARTISKEIRLWNKAIYFRNPVYECLTDDNADYLNGVIYSKPLQNEETSQLIKEWKNAFPMSEEPHYYEACHLLSSGNYEGFLRSANLYLFKDNKRLMPVTMLRYYCALVYCYAKGDARLAIQYIVPCIEACPLMAEFWCLLGDIYYKIMKDYNKAFAFYDNAIFLGTRRLRNDPWPMEINKYKDYPSELRRSCINKINSLKVLGLPKV